MNLKKIKLLCCLLPFTLGTYAQVTIGSEHTPKEGAILDLKETNTLGTNSIRGLNLPRVALIAKPDLAPCIVSASPAETSSHRGLTVYNISTTKDLCPGVHVWDGKNWMPLERNKMGDTPTIAGDKYSNSFIISPGAKITIPIARAYQYWTTQSVNVSTNQNDITIELLWQDTKGLFFNPELRWDTSNPEESVIYMETACSPKKGNAVVAVKENGVIRWSWHVWVTDYDPTKDDLDFNRNSWMKQNLGALSTSPEDASTSGLYYQWGRKDPFPGAKDLSKSKIEQTNVSPGVGVLDAIKPLYDGDSNPTFITTQIPDLPNMLSKAVTTPTVFYYKDNPPQNPSSKWYASDDVFDNKTLWGGDADGDIGTSGPKTIYDPCPNGWRLPTLTTWNHLWRAVLNTGNINQNISWINPNGTGAVGFDLKDFGFLQFGGSYYPTGNMDDIKSSMTLWSGTINAAGYAITMALSRTASNTVHEFSPGTTGEHPAHGANVRCVREES